MTFFLVRCQGCDLGLHSWAEAPLCAECRLSLISCPQDRLDESRSTAGIESLHCRYLLVGRSFKIVKRWKKSGGVWINQALLDLPADLLDKLRSLRLEAVVPIPQRKARSWVLGGSPALRIARRLARDLALPLAPVLAPPPFSHARAKDPRQAELGLEQRLSRFIPFQIQLPQGNVLPRSVLLVDDIWTSGATLRSAALILGLSGVRSSHGFCLGFRPSLSIRLDRGHAENSTDLRQRKRGAETIGEKSNGGTLHGS